MSRKRGHLQVFLCCNLLSHELVNKATISLQEYDDSTRVTPLLSLYARAAMAFVPS